VSWWSFRVSTPFSFLCLILLTHFHKNARFRPNMLNYLNTTYTFGKQTTDDFINRKVQCTHSFIFSFRARFSFGESLRAAALGESGSLTMNSNLRLFCWLHTKTRPSKVGDVVTPCGPWTNSRPLSRGCRPAMFNQMAYWVKNYVTVLTRAAH